MPRFPSRAGLFFGAVLLAALLAEGWGLPTKKPRGSRLRSQARLAEVSSGRGATRLVPLPARLLWPLGERGRDRAAAAPGEGWAGRGPGARGLRSPHSLGRVARKPGEQLPFCAK